VGFPETDDDQRVFTSADVAALADAAGLLTAGMLDPDGLVELARPFGHLLSRFAAAQTSFLSDVLGARIAAGHLAEDPTSGEHMAGQAVLITQELLPVLERTPATSTSPTWRSCSSGSRRWWATPCSPTMAASSRTWAMKCCS